MAGSSRKGRDTRIHVRTAAFFDLDKTIIATSSSSAFGRSFLSEGLLTRSDAIRAAYAQLLFQIGGADERQTSRLRDALSELIEGWDVATVRRIVNETVHEHIDPVVYAEALDLIRRHQMNGRDVIIVSASVEDVVQPIADLLGADGILASQLDVEDGRYTGGITSYMYGQTKADAIADLADRRGYDLRGSYAYSDSITDVPMLSIVGHGFAVNPDRALRRAAIDRGWGMLRFVKPVGLRSGVGTRPVLVTLGVVAVAVVVGVWLYRAAGRAADDD
ncbi:HAD family hydrolase [Demequina capsici]|uniref:HAD family hydrolase n=1 Tax=Demequina capsici TaxID=3075620 RepID=A0AA96FCS0_9MICO|nr:HAD family hydrolase [Demequina sp. PMTSA13]WNM27738.1 HAD family hydrolase [Demequina sp. PMTSA13]